MFDFLKKLFGGPDTTALEAAINEGALLVDVRTPAEFAMGSVRGAINIPLDAVLSKIAKFKNKKAVVVFCASGSRSGQAQRMLSNKGIPNVINGGPWRRVYNIVNK